MQYEQLGETADIAETTNYELSIDHAKKQGVHDAVSDITRISIVGGILLLVYMVVPKKHITKLTREAKSLW